LNSFNRWIWTILLRHLNHFNESWGKRDLYRDLIIIFSQNNNHCSRVLICFQIYFKFNYNVLQTFLTFVIFYKWDSKWSPNKHVIFQEILLTLYCWEEKIVFFFFLKSDIPSKENKLKYQYNKIRCVSYNHLKHVSCDNVMTLLF